MNLEVSEGENTANHVSLVIAEELASLEKCKEIPLDQKDDYIELSDTMNYLSSPIIAAQLIS
ncbi:4291_t:CDS:2 [Gigaspora margarita]|uniref:4291_t:CDS:1 n=1 Tax=Gigaspora margarita TaxID=4874 RepID=A0ABN7VNW4_GIGMA|nr:4291_t:CDS:2 [Gigaspora margarita]